MRDLRLKEERVARDLKNRVEHVTLLKDQVYRLTIMKQEQDLKQRKMQDDAPIQMA